MTCSSCGVDRTDGHDHPAAGLQLIQQRLRYVIRRGGDDDDVEWRLLRPAGVTVAGANRDVRVFELPQERFGIARELRFQLDRVDVRDERREHCRLISRPGADFQRAIALRADGRVRSSARRCTAGKSSVPRRSAADCPCTPASLRLGYEAMARHVAKRLQYAFIAHAASLDLLAHHALTLGSIVERRRRDLARKNVNTMTAAMRPTAE